MTPDPTQTRYIVQVAHKQRGHTRIVGDAAQYDPHDLSAMQRLIATFPWLNEDTIESFSVHILGPGQWAHSVDLSATQRVSFG
jgi:hypothetical protein